eukprot:TRINITY_DN76109_c0_g1_i1.p1 TRINITY_DN76109_c0_g1~~TRINITY_DN76109_c0_g1_i1.p1  ORF type:complete len:334 (-),score=44.18 TRINITY_DN76109_c0_g1_i1:498-1499(-)
MVRLRVGRFAWELYYTRTAAVLPRQEMKRRAGILLGHLGYITGMAEYVMTDMVMLRSFAVCGCSMIAGFQLVQPKVQWISVIWNTTYASINLSQIYLLTRSPPPLTDEEEALLHVIGGLMSHTELKTISSIGSWRFFEDGMRLADASQPDADREIFIIASGSCCVCVGGVEVGHLRPGSVIGVDAMSSPASPTPPVGTTLVGTVISRGDVKCLAIPVESFNECLNNDDALRGAVNGLLANSLAANMAARLDACKAQEYEAILEVTCGSVATSSVSSALSGFRSDRGISEEEHARILATIQHRGTTGVVAESISADVALEGDARNAAVASVEVE